MVSPVAYISTSTVHPIGSPIIWLGLRAWSYIKRCLGQIWANGVVTASLQQEHTHIVIHTQMQEHNASHMYMYVSAPRLLAGVPRLVSTVAPNMQQVTIIAQCVCSSSSPPMTRFPSLIARRRSTGPFSSGLHLLLVVGSVANLPTLHVLTSRLLVDN